MNQGYGQRRYPLGPEDIRIPFRRGARPKTLTPEFQQCITQSLKEALADRSKYRVHGLVLLRNDLFTQLQCKMDGVDRGRTLRKSDVAFWLSKDPNIQIVNEIMRPTDPPRETNSAGVCQQVKQRDESVQQIGQQLEITLDDATQDFSGFQEVPGIVHGGDLTDTETIFENTTLWNWDVPPNALRELGNVLPGRSSSEG